MATTTSPTSKLPTATVREAKSHFSALLERAAGGQATVITSRGRIVARIMPPDGANPDGMNLAAALQATVQSGLCEAPDQPWVSGATDPIPADAGTSISDMVADQRR